MDNFSLGLEELALEAGDDELPVRLRLADIDRRIGAVEGVEQFVAELADEILKAQGQRGRFRIEQFALYGLNVGNGGFDLGGHGDAPKKMGMHHPLRGDDMPQSGKKNRHAADGGRKCRR